MIQCPPLFLPCRSIIEPIRNVSIFDHSGDFHLASAESIDLTAKRVRCRSVLDSRNLYDLDYDKLVVGVGALPSTFNVPGVEQFSFFLKASDVIC